MAGAPEPAAATVLELIKSKVALFRSAVHPPCRQLCSTLGSEQRCGRPRARLWPRAPGPDSTVAVGQRPTCTGGPSPGALHRQTLRDAALQLHNPRLRKGRFLSKAFSSV